MGFDPDILPLLEAARFDPTRRWEVANSAKIRSIVEREVGRHAAGFHEAEDLRSETTVALVETLERHDLEFENENRAIAYFDVKIKGLVESALRRSTGAQFHYGRVQRREFASGLFDEKNEAGSPWQKENSVRNWRKKRGHEVFRDRFEGFREFAEGYPNPLAPRVYVARGQGAKWGSIAERLDLPGKETARELYHEFLASVVDHFVEQGEFVPVTILGVYIEDPEVSVALLRGGRRIVRSWTVECSDVEDLRDLDRSLRCTMNLGAAQVVLNESQPSEASVVLRLVARDRNIDIETWDLGGILVRLRPDVLASFSMKHELQRGERLAVLLAMAKAAENSLKSERYR